MFKASISNAQGHLNKRESKCEVEMATHTCSNLGLFPYVRNNVRLGFESSLEYMSLGNLQMDFGVRGNVAAPETDLEVISP